MKKAVLAVATDLQWWYAVGAPVSMAIKEKLLNENSIFNHQICKNRSFHVIVNRNPVVCLFYLGYNESFSQRINTAMHTKYICTQQHTTRAFCKCNMKDSPMQSGQNLSLTPPIEHITIKQTINTRICVTHNLCRTLC